MYIIYYTTGLDKHLNLSSICYFTQTFVTLSFFTLIVPKRQKNIWHSKHDEILLLMVTF